MKVAIIILSDTETHESLGRVVNALSFAKELKENVPISLSSGSSRHLAWMASSIPALTI